MRARKQRVPLLAFAARAGWVARAHGPVGLLNTRAQRGLYARPHRLLDVDSARSAASGRDRSERRFDVAVIDGPRQRHHPLGCVCLVRLPDRADRGRHVAAALIAGYCRGED